WMITHRPAPNVVRFSELFVRTDLQPLGRGICLMAESIKLYMAYATLHGMRDTLIGSWVVDPLNTPMIHFTERRIGPYLLGRSESRGSWKPLANGAAAQSGAQA